MDGKPAGRGRGLWLMALLVLACGWVHAQAVRGPVSVAPMPELLELTSGISQVFLPRSIVVVGDMGCKVDLRDAAGQLQQLGHRRR